MIKRLLLSVFVCLSMTLTGSTAGGAGLEDLYQVRNAGTGRVSSADPDWKNGNADKRSLAAGETLTIADLKGPGIIRHIWFTIGCNYPEYPRWLTLRMYWDGQDQPAVETPIGDFFAVGHGALANVDSLPVAVSSEGRALNCYWPMPFSRSAKITLSNDSRNPVRSIYYQVDYEGTHELPATIAYFHAQYRQEYPAKMGEDYLILDAEGRGQYVGTVLSVGLRSPGWFGEGDDRFYIDGASEPQIRGTGTEDYFCDAWGFRVLNRPFYGITLNGSGKGRDFGDLITAYRWHINDPVYFNRSLKVTIEDKGNVFDDQGRAVTGFAERSDLVSSVAFWYQTGRAKRFATLPPADERVIPRRAVEFEQMVKTAKAQPAGATVESHKGKFSGGAQLWAKFAGPQAELTIPFNLDKVVRGPAKLRLTKFADYGVFEIKLDGKVVPRMEAVDLYAPDVTPADLNMGDLQLAAGDHTLTFKCVGKNPVSQGYALGADALEVMELTPYVVPSSAPAK